MRLALWLVRRLAPREWQESIAGDLCEEREQRRARGESAGAAWAAVAALVTVARITREDRRGEFPMTARGFHLDAWIADIRHAIRSLRASPGFTAIALAVLTLGIGASTAIFSVADAVVLRGLPFDEADRLVAVGEMDPKRAGPPVVGATTAPTFYDWRREQHVFQAFAATAASNDFITRDGARPERLTVLRATAQFFDVLRARPRIGRVFTEHNEIVGNHRVAVISDGYWHRRFGADPNVVGKTVNIDTGAWEVIGVMPPDFSYPIAAAAPTDMWVPFAPLERNDQARGGGRNYYFRSIARLQDNVSIDEAAAAMDGITRQLAAQYPKWFDDRVSIVRRLHEATVGSARSWMHLMLGAVALVLLIACVNVANLMLARATTRVRETTVRAALGASRWQIARGLLIESLVLSVTGTLLALVVAQWGVDVLRSNLPRSLPRIAAIGIDFRVLAAAALASVTTGLLFGLLPALQFSRPNLAGAISDGGRAGMASRGRQRMRSALVIIEVALAVVLLVGAGLFVSSFVRLINVDLGLDYHNVMTVGLNPRLNMSQKDAFERAQERTPLLVADAVQRLRSLPGVQSVSAVQGGMPLSGSWYRNSITVAGTPEFDKDNDQVDIRKVMPAYADVVRASVTRGRYISSSDAIGTPLVVVINEESARRFFNGRDPIGMTVKLDDAERQVVGIVRDVRLGGPEASIRPEAYLPFAQTTSIGATLAIRTASDPAPLGPAVREVIQSLLPDVPVQDPITMQGSLTTLLAQRKFNMLLVGLFGVLAIVIAAVGIYGVMAYVVAQQTKEIGLRMALGAVPRGILRMVLARAAVVMAIGTLSGFAAAWFLGASVKPFIVAVEPHDPWVFACVAILLTSAGLVAAFVPARRAARVDPMVALRTD